MIRRSYGTHESLGSSGTVDHVAQWGDAQLPIDRQGPRVDCAPRESEHFGDIREAQVLDEERK